MKNVIIITLLLAFSAEASAQEESKFFKTMKSTIAKMDTAQTQTTIIKAANKFERIAQAEKTEWLAYYWAGYANTLAGFFEKDKDIQAQMLIKADNLLTISDSLSPKNSEVYCVKSFWYVGKMMNEGMMSAMKYGPLSSAALDSAKIYNPENPRQYFLKGSALAQTPKQFGGGCDKGIPVLITGVEKFKIFKPKSEIHPVWGEERCQQMLEQCNSSDDGK